MHLLSFAHCIAFSTDAKYQMPNCCCTVNKTLIVLCSSIKKLPIHLDQIISSCFMLMCYGSERNFYELKVKCQL